MTQPITLTPGWNAVYLYVQPEPRSFAAIFTNLPVDEVKKWNRPEVGSQFDIDPSKPFPRQGDFERWFATGSSEDSVYLSTDGNLLASEAYYIHVKTNASAFTLNLKGRPVANSYAWNANSYNLYGLPVATNSARTFSEFFASSSDIPTAYGAASRIYSVSPGGNEYVVYQPNLQPIVRGKAYWFLCNQRSSYAGPLSVQVDGSDGWLDFGGDVTPKTITIRNVSTNLSRQVMLRQQASENAPAGTNAVAGPVPLMYGVMSWDPKNLGINYVTMPSVLTNTLAPGGVLQLSIRPDPSALVNPAANSFYQSVLSISDIDSQNKTFVNQFVGVRFVASPQVIVGGDPAGLWVGDVWVTGVNRARIGSFATNWDTSVVSPVTRPFQFRIIMEVSSNRTARLLQQAFIAWKPSAIQSVPGMDKSYIAGTNVILHTMDEAIAFLAAHTNGQVSRVSAINFPFMDPQPLSGTFGTTNTGSFLMPYNDPVNPFVHVYSPDHDNKEYHNSVAANVAAGIESYNITRAMSFQFSATDSLGNKPPDWGISEWGGTYSETVSGLLTPGAVIKAEGIFTLQRIASPVK